MSPDEKQALIEKKIDGLSPKQRKRVEGYVDALLESLKPNSDLENEGNKSVDQKQVEESGGDVEYLDLSFRGALSHLADEYTAEELQEKANEWRMKKALDY